MKLVVQDASILIDLALSETVEAWFATGIETWTTELIYPREIDRPDQRSLLSAYVSAEQLKVKSFGETELEELHLLKSKIGRGLSLADVSVFALAKQFGSTTVLATGDQTLRKAAERERVSACGILGLMDYMVGSVNGRPPVLPVPVAIEKLRKLQGLPECRIPQNKCKRPAGDLLGGRSRSG